MSKSRARRTTAIVPKHVLDHATSERFLTVEEHARNLQRQEIKTMYVGQKGRGKTDSVVQRLNRLLNGSDDKNRPKVAEITDEEFKELYRAEREYKSSPYFPEVDVSAQANGISTGNAGSINEGANNFKRADVNTSASGGGGGGSNNISYLYRPSQTNQTPQQLQQYRWWDNQQAPYQYGWGTSTTLPGEQRSPDVEKQEQSKKQEFKPEDYKGKFCAIVTLTHRGIEHHGILFVKKCGYWKLCDYGGKKLSGGTSGSFEADLEKGTLKITVHQTIYTDAPPEMSEDDLEIL